MTTSSYEKKWLIKTDQKITGPFSYEQVEDLLRKRQISLIDEIRDMEKRWSFIREVPELKPLVESIRKELDNGNDLTQTIQTKVHQDTQSITKKEFTITKEATTTPPLNIENLSPPVEDSSPNDNEESVIDVDFKENESSVQAQVAYDAQQKAKILRFGSTTDYKVQSEVKSDRLQYLIVFGVFMLASLLAYIWHGYSKQQEAQKLDAEIVNQIRKHAMNFQNEKVVDSFSRAPNHLRKKVLPDLINYFPLLQNYEVSNKEEFISRFKLENNLNNPKKSLLEMYLFHRSMSMLVIDDAKKYLVSAKDLDPTSEIVAENEALFALRMERYKEAYDRFKRLFEKNPKGRWLFGRLVAQYKLGQFFDIEGEQDVIDKYLITRFDFKRELLMFQIYLSKKQNNKRMFEHSIRDYINSPVQFSVNYRVDPLIWFAGYDLKVLDSVYQQILQKQRGFDFEKMQLAFTTAYSFEKKNYEVVKNFVASGGLENSNPDKININFQYLILQERKMEAMAVVESFGMTKLNAYSQFLVFKTLTENNILKETNSELYEKARENLTKGNNLFSEYAKFLTLKQTNMKAQLQDFLDIGLTTTPDFIPFLVAKGELN